MVSLCHRAALFVSNVYNLIDLTCSINCNVFIGTAKKFMPINFPSKVYHDKLDFSGLCNSIPKYMYLSSVQKDWWGEFLKQLQESFNSMSCS